MMASDVRIWDSLSIKERDDAKYKICSWYVCESCDIIITLPLILTSEVQL